MTLKVISGEAVFNLRFQNFDNDEHNIKCTSDENPSFSVPIAYPLEILNIFPPENFKVYLFKRRNQKENDIFQVFDKKRDVRIGWCFPVQALCSTDHSFATNEFFLRYAYVTAIRLFQDIQETGASIPDIGDKDFLSFSDFFPDYAAILTISLETLENEFAWEDWVPSLFAYGYSPLHEQIGTEPVHEGNLPAGGKLKLTHISSSVQSRTFVDGLFAKLLPYEANPLVLFFYLYQIIELLLAQVFEQEQRIQIQNLISAEKDPIETKEILRKISEISSEKHRLLLLTEHYIGGTLDRMPLTNACNTFIQAVGKEERQSLHEALYHARNIIFHQYRDVPYEISLLLEEVVREFSQTIIIMLSNYRNIHRNIRVVNRNCYSYAHLTAYL